MTSTLLPPAVNALRAISLTALNEEAELQTRHDRKYLLSPLNLWTFVELMAPRCRVLEIEGRRTFAYESVYFDTPDLVSYTAAAIGRPDRCKVRIRRYVDSGATMLEVKTRDQLGRTVKNRTSHPADERYTLTADARRFIEDTTSGSFDHASLRPVLVTRYNRTTLLSTDSKTRVTIDTELEWTGGGDKVAQLNGTAIVETKGFRQPGEADRLLWSRHCRPAKVSKYCTGLAALHPELGANKWNRVLREHFNRLPAVGTRAQRALPS